MLSTVYYYVSVQYFTSLDDAEELKSLLFKMKIINQNEEYIYDIEIDEILRHVFLELSPAGYLYLIDKSFDTIDIKLQKVVLFMSAAYKYKRN